MRCSHDNSLSCTKRDNDSSRDSAPGLPDVRTVGEDAEHGRGMYLIATLASRYGMCVDGPGPGKSFWFQLGG